MKKFIILVFVITFFNCKNEKKQEITEEDNIELQRIYRNDKAAWDSGTIIYDLDSIRRMRVNQLLDSSKIKTANDFKHAAIVFEHGMDSTNLKKALKLIKKAAELDSTINKKLYASITDQYLLSIGKPQIYGTVFKTMDNGLLQLAEIDTTQITDKERIKNGVETLSEQKSSLEKANIKRAEMIERIKKR